ncbi:MAG: DNA-binding transcriptional regulator Fis [Gammaproteobacteria bacterium]|nr:DNA-binding transcriptional regulator Fis [Gammaproteobacteria bacterium]MBK8306638.1 DNA-binding transcriptional regulator Fis [Gammaproteobacteria bacterium]
MSQVNGADSPATNIEPAVAPTRSLRQSVEITVGNYFSQLDGQMVTDVYDMVLQEVEAPLLEAVLKYTRNNQTLASAVLGLNRGTLRKKLKRYGML